MRPRRRCSRSVLRDKDELREIRQIAASALQALKPEKLRAHAREMLMDKSEYDDIQATSLTALTQFGGQAVANDEALLKSVDRLSGAPSAKVKQSGSPLPSEVRPLTGRSCRSLAAPAPQSEAAFAAFVDVLAANAVRHDALTDLLREDHPVYDQRGTATVVRMRGWVLLALARTGVPDAALLLFSTSSIRESTPISLRQPRVLCARIRNRLPASRRSSCTRSPTFAIETTLCRFDEYGGYALGVDAHQPRRRAPAYAGVAWTGCARNPHGARAARLA